MRGLGHSETGAADLRAVRRSAVGTCAVGRGVVGARGIGRVAAVGLVLVGCGAEPTPAPVAPPRAAPPVVSLAEVALPLSEWADATSSPQVAAAEGRVAAIAAACGPLDAALTRAAEKLLAAPDADVEARLRIAGSPAVRPRVVTVHGAASDDALKAKLASLHQATTRCGVAANDDTTTIVLADFLADLEPLPVRARTGAWLTFAAHLAVPASGAKLVVLGERGAPKSIPTSISGDKVRARFALDRPGGFTVQLVADVAGGPRPVLEARVFADVTPTTDDPTAPGESESSLDAMVAAVRKEEGLHPLKRDARLDALAKAHAEAMQKAGHVAHDVGDGDLAERFQAEGYAASTVGENVARARTLALGHRALYASPSHRANLLGTQFTRFGFATVHDDSDHLWICEVFVSEMR